VRFEKNRRAIAKILREGFPGHKICDLEIDGDAFVRIVGEDGGVKHRIQMSREFMNNHTSDDALDLCSRWHLMEALKAAGTVKVLVTSQGITWAGQSYADQRQHRPGP
jgi:hypothetical protein